MKVDGVAVVFRQGAHRIQHAAVRKLIRCGQVLVQLRVLLVRCTGQVPAAVATKALREKTELDIGIKWPNDLVVSGKKISGILTEMSAEIDYINHVVIGIGINVNMESFPEDIAKTATSLRIEAGKEFRRFELIAAIMEHFEKAYEAVCKAGSLKPIMEDYNRLLVNCGRRVRVLEPEHEYDALALGIDKTGELQVECEDGSRKSVFAGEVSVRGIYGYV